MRPLLATALLTATFAAAGCGGPDQPSDEEQIKATLRDYYTAFANGDTDSACADLASDVQQQFAKQSGTEDCPTAIAKARLRPQVRRYTARFEEAEIVSVKVSGDRATASVRAIGVTKSIPMRREGKEWKIDASSP